MEKILYNIGDKDYEVSVDGSPEFKVGDDEYLSNEYTDITYNQDWYDYGYTEKQFLGEAEFTLLKNAITSSIKSLIEEELSVDTTGFNLENYHKYVTDNDSHYKIVSKTRQLFDYDFVVPVEEITNKLGNILSMELTDIDPKTQCKQWIIVRINRPGSTDYNPPHKDIYEGVDNFSYIPKFVNFWIPIAGVTEKTSLPLSPKSHKLNENLINRTFDGGVVEGNKYRVRMIKTWDNDNKLIRSTVNYGETLIFSGHLIHGMAINNEKDITRVALEFRLYKK